MGTPFLFGSEFRIGTSSGSYQFEPALAALPDGRFVVTYTDQLDDGHFLNTGDYNVRAQIFAADGTALGPAFPVNTTTQNFQGACTIAALADGCFVISWSDGSETGGDESSLAIRAQVFKSDGSKSGQEFLVNTTTQDFQGAPVITALIDGRFVVSWSDFSETRDQPSVMTVRAQVFNSDGTKSGAEIPVDIGYYGNNAKQQAITALADGGFAVSWTDYRTDRNGSPAIDVHARIFHADGSASSHEFRVNTTTAGTQSTPAITALADGRFLMTWSDRDQSTSYPSDYFLRAQLFNANGTKSGGQILVNKTSTQQTAPAAALPDGRFVITWAEREGFSSPEIFAQVFNADGSKADGAFIVNTSTNRFQGDPAIAVLADGRFIITWTDYGAISRDPAHNHLSNVHGQIFDARLAGIDISGTSASDDYYGTRFDDVMRGGAGHDRLAGGDGNDVLNGGHGSDIMIGGAGNDLYILKDTGDSIIEEQAGGIDTVQSANLSIDLANYAEIENVRLTGSRALDLTGSGGNNVLRGNNGANCIDGSHGNDRLFGNGDNDTLSGGTGRDRLEGGLGDDVLSGGDGKDIFVFAPGYGADSVTDFEDNHDLIDLSAFGFITFGEAARFAADTAIGVVFTFAPGTTLRIEHITMDQLTSADFIL